MNLTKNTQYPNIVKLFKLLNELECPLFISIPNGYKGCLYLNAENHYLAAISFRNRKLELPSKTKALLFELNIKESHVNTLLPKIIKLESKYSGYELNLLKSYRIYKDKVGNFYISSKENIQEVVLDRDEDKWQFVGKL